MEQSTKFFNQIPVPIIEADDLNDFEKLLFSEIYTMANSYGSIFPSNAYLATRYGKTKVTISNTLRKLQEKGYIDLEYRYSGKEIDKRFIYPCLNKLNGGIKENFNTPKRKFKEGIKENFKDNISSNKSINKSFNNISDKSDKESDLENRFSLLWKMYPNKKGKPKALTAYKKAVKSGVTDKEIQTGIENYLAEINAKGTLKDYIKHGSTWFNGKGWEDDYDTTPRQEIFAGNKVVKSAPSWATPYTEPEYTDEEIADVFKE
ncbi:helix-turn-helix domain-containing protein [Lactococcus petauri]|uniref:Helix-turn-helix domain-containing protein n=1 Tax=Lactococcus petauri TaxID=1940789 RepID=A0ABZ2SEW6_9LACT|nr:helix-turn-helix domain-containing protein [Lactococcus petauri]OAL09679.1 putative phage protein [Lactococcus garvieae]MCV5951986.1 helix-turn-helix domain-containing protein [Lactococcus petauri]MCV5966527.1 helix-turn-helix domain-containing protein [Lactococcus petauri]MCV5969419.1 helix-turn-helix domain-containing protein [Lactococcus petauri]MCV5979841.1 helix-turn-helix domain-containing protein [Lactococcus petauri]